MVLIQMLVMFKLLVLWRLPFDKQCQEHSFMPFKLRLMVAIWLALCSAMRWHKCKRFAKSCQKCLNWKAVSMRSVSIKEVCSSERCNKLAEELKSKISSHSLHLVNISLQYVIGLNSTKIYTFVCRSRHFVCSRLSTQSTVIRLFNHHCSSKHWCLFVTWTIYW